MYPDGEIGGLAARRELLCARIAARRQASVEAAVELTRPLGWIDQMVARWRGVSPLIKLVGVPAGLYVLRSVFRVGRGRWVMVGMLMRFILRATRAAGKSRAA